MKLIKNFALVVSWISHPLFSSAIMVGLVSMKRKSTEEGIMLMVIIFFTVVLPANLYTFYRVRKGSYTDYDVSSQNQRPSFYKVLIILMTISSSILLYNQPGSGMFWGCLLTTLLLICGYVINGYLKVSLHVSLNLFFSFILILFYPNFTLFSFLFCAVVAWSRWTLGRHRGKEILAGTLLGLSFGVIMQLVV